MIFAHLAESDSARQYSLTSLGFARAARGHTNDSDQAFKQSVALSTISGVPISPYEGYMLLTLWDGQFELGSTLAQQAETFYEQHRYERRRIHAHWIHGLVMLALDRFQEAEEYLYQALLQARSLNQIGEEIPTRIWFAELRRRQGNTEAARELLNEVWEPAERGSFRLYLADAYNVLAQIEYDAGNTTSAITAANKAYERAWCDGPPFAYHWGLQKAKAMLATLNAPEPSLPPFDPAGREPIPHVEIVPSEETE